MSCGRALGAINILPNLSLDPDVGLNMGLFLFIIWDCLLPVLSRLFEKKCLVSVIG